MRFFGMTLGEIATLVGLLGTFGAWPVWISRKAYNVVKDNMTDPIRRNLDGLSEAITKLSENVESETKWIHDRHSEVVTKLGEHEERLDDHTIKLTKHEQQIKTLFRKEK